MSKSKDQFSQAALDAAFYEGRDEGYSEGAWVGASQMLISMSLVPLSAAFGLVVALAAAPVVVIASRDGGPPLGRALQAVSRRLS